MSYDYSGYIECPALQSELDREWQHNPQVVQDAIGLIQFLNSPVNTAMILQNKVYPGAGKVRKVELVYQPRLVTGSSTSADIACSGGEEDGETSTTIELDISVGQSAKWKITPKLLAVRCQEDATYVAKQVMRRMELLERQIDIEAAEFAAANLGEFIDGTSSKNTKTKTTTGAWADDLIGDTVAELQFIEWMIQQPAVFGDGLLTKYMRATQAGCCALMGVDLREFAAQNPLIFLRDVNIETALGTSNSYLSMGPGAIQMLKYLEFEGTESQFNTPQLKQGVVYSPRTGLPFDYYAEYSCGVWNFQLKLAYKFEALPEDVYYTDDRLAGKNGLQKFVIVNP